ncbi:MAG TPA: SDR family NAD(P)-dependent oxidoreductase [Balneolales bacterium]|nr:SDR family NAD(P)-dependent oxidoreductase [Balneolales bacterium]
MKRAVVIGATSGIGKALVYKLHKQGYIVGATGRRFALLESLENDIASNIFIQQQDVRNTADAIKQLVNLIERMGGLDLIIINAGIGNNNKDYLWEIERNTIDVNIRGFVAMTNTAFNYFRENNGGKGHIVGISSVAAHFSFGKATAYNSSKAFVSHYLKGLRFKAHQLNNNITVTDIKPGFVATPLTRNNKAMFWVISSERAAELIYRVIDRRKDSAYIPSRWSIIARLFPLVPDFIKRNI